MTETAEVKNFLNFKEIEGNFMKNGGKHQEPKTTRKRHKYQNWKLFQIENKK